MSNIVEIDSYTPTSDDKFLFDANIWLYLYCPIGNYKKGIIKKYDGFLKNVIHSKSSIYVSSLILSEVFNRWVRLDFDILKESDPSKYIDFKRNFRNTQNYKDSVSTIKTVVKSQIMKIAHRIDDKFSTISLDKLFEEIENSDFNDNYFLAMATLENFKIVTHDSDFAFSSQKLPITVLTANKKMFK